jgi:hypothetical protein
MTTIFQKNTTQYSNIFSNYNIVNILEIFFSFIKKGV